MKKIIVTLAGVLLFAGAAFGAASGYQAIESGYSFGSGANALTIKGSKGVKLDYSPDAAGQGYVMAASHDSGTKTYGTSSGDTKIYYKDGTQATIPSTVPTGSNTADFSGWTSL